MRYEGDFVITADGAKVGDKMPKYYNEIEEIMKNKLLSAGQRR